MTLETRRLDEVISTLIDYRGKTPTKTDSGVRLITAKVIKDGFINESSFEFIAEDEYDTWMRRGLPQQWDIVITTEAPMGEVAQLRTAERVALAQRVILLRADPQVMDQNFLFHALKSPFVRAELSRRATGTTVLGVKQSELRQIRIPYYSLHVQRHLAGILSAYDNLIENNTKRIKILEEMARSLYREWFVHFRFPGHEMTMLVDAPGGKIPKGWESCRLGDLVEETREAVDPSTMDPAMPYFGLEHLPRRSIALGTWGTAGEVQSTKLHVRVDDILFGKIRPYFHKVGVTPVGAVCSSDTIVMRVKSSEHFGTVLCCVSSDDFVAHATRTSQGTKMPRASWDVLRKYPIALAPPRLLVRFNEIIVDSVQLIHRLVLKNRSLATSRDLLLPRLISGEIDVSSLPLPPAA